MFWSLFGNWLVEKISVCFNLHFINSQWVWAPLTSLKSLLCFLSCKLPSHGNVEVRCLVDVLLEGEISRRDPDMQGRARVLSGLGLQFCKSVVHRWFLQPWKWINSPKERMNKAEGRGLRPERTGLPTSRRWVQKEGQQKTEETQTVGRRSCWEKQWLRRDQRVHWEVKWEERCSGFDNMESLINLRSVSVEWWSRHAGLGWRSRDRSWRQHLQDVLPRWELERQDRVG